MATISILPSGEYNLSIVGESFYKDNIKRYISDDHDVVTGSTKVTAELIPEPSNPKDNNAIRVEINSDTVGYLSKEDALWLHNHYRQHNCPRTLAVSVGAEIRGHERSANEKRRASDYGIVLDISETNLVEQLKLYAPKFKKEGQVKMIILAAIVGLIFLAIAIAEFTR